MTTNIITSKYGLTIVTIISLTRSNDPCFFSNLIRIFFNIDLYKNLYSQYKFSIAHFGLVWHVFTPLSCLTIMAYLRSIGTWFEELMVLKYATQ